MEILKSQKGIDKLAYNGYIYRKNTKTLHSQYWRCVKRKCRGTATTLVNYEKVCNVSECQPHNHEPNLAHQEVSQAIDAMLKEASTTNLPPRMIINDASLTLSEEAINNLPKVKALTSRIQRKRMRLEGKVLPEPKTLADLDIPSSHVVAGPQEEQERFLLYDSKYEEKEEKRVLIFATDQMLGLLAESTTWMFDGSFEVSPPLFDKLCTVHASRNGRMFPCIYALLPDSTPDSYRLLFRIIKETCSEAAPQSIITDLDKTSESVLRAEFCQAKFYGCVFHFYKSVSRKLVSLGLRSEYVDNNALQQYVKMLCALAFLPRADVVKGYESIEEELESSKIQDVFEPLIMDFEDTYVGRLNRKSVRRRPMHDIEMWNVHERAEEEIARWSWAERWHEELEARLGDRRPSIWKFLKGIQAEERLQRSSLFEMQMGEFKDDQDVEQSNVNDQLLDLIVQRQSSSDLDIPTLLKKVGQHINFCI